MSYVHINRDLTRKLVAFLDRIPRFPASWLAPHAISLMDKSAQEEAVAVVDIVDLPHKLVDLYRFLVIAEARSLRRRGKLTAESRQALIAYEQALLLEQRACGLLMRQLSKDYGNGMVSLK